MFSLPFGVAFGGLQSSEPANVVVTGTCPLHWDLLIVSDLVCIVAYSNRGRIMTDFY